MACERTSDVEEKHDEAFGVDTGFSRSFRREIDQIKNNDRLITSFNLEHRHAEIFSEVAWEQLGRCMSNNDHLVTIGLSNLSLTDSNVAPLFRGLAKGGPLKELNISGNNFGFDGIRSMVPLLTSAPNLSKLFIGHNVAINSECFSLLVEALHSGGSIETLHLSGCGIDDITALGHLTLPHLQFLSLSSNNIQIFPPSSLENYANLEALHLNNNKVGREGCRSIAKLLQKEGSRLKYLDLMSNNLGDEEAEIIANSLKNNTVLMELFLDENNNFTEKAFTAFSMLLNDVSSIDSTYNSNHTLKYLNLPDPIKSCSTTYYRFRGTEEQQQATLRKVHFQLNLIDHVAGCKTEVCELHPRNCKKMKSYIKHIIRHDINARGGCRVGCGVCKSMCMLLTIKKRQVKIREMDDALRINRLWSGGNPHRPGRAKVIGTQLNSDKRMKLSYLQGVDYSYGSLFADIEPVLLPEVLALIGGRHGPGEFYRTNFRRFGNHTELYKMLVATAPDLISAGAGRPASVAPRGKKRGGKKGEGGGKKKRGR